MYVAPLVCRIYFASRSGRKPAVLFRNEKILILLNEHELNIFLNRSEKTNKGSTGNSKDELHSFNLQWKISFSILLKVSNK